MLPQRAAECNARIWGRESGGSAALFYFRSTPVIVRHRHRVTDRSPVTVQASATGTHPRCPGPGNRIDVERPVLRGWLIPIGITRGTVRGMTLQKLDETFDPRQLVMLALLGKTCRLSSH